jgi:hypothetical protein
MCCRFHELHLLLPIHRPNTLISACRDTLTHSTTLFLGLHLLGFELVAFWAVWRALLPHRRRMRHLRGWSDHIHANVPNRTPLLHYVPASHGIFLRFPAHLALGLCDSRTTKSEEGCYTGIGDGCVECDEHRYCLSVSRVERTVSI